MFVAFGILAIVLARNYPLGSALRMGPGYFPTYLGAIMIVIGAIMTGRAYRIEGKGIGRWGWRPLLVLRWERLERPLHPMGAVSKG